MLCKLLQYIFKVNLPAELVSQSCFASLLVCTVYFLQVVMAVFYCMEQWAGLSDFFPVDFLNIDEIQSPECKGY